MSITLEHIVDQLDVLTQVSCGKICEQGIVLETKSLGGGGGGDGGCTPVSDPITLPFMGENTSDVEALQLLSLSPLPPPRRRNT